MACVASSCREYCHFACTPLLIDYRFSCPFVSCPLREFRRPSDTLLEKSGRLEVRESFFFLTAVLEQLN
jgi:hypothetical protein